MNQILLTQLQFTTVGSMMKLSSLPTLKHSPQTYSMPSVRVYVASQEHNMHKDGISGTRPSYGCPRMNELHNQSHSVALPVQPPHSSANKCLLHKRWAFGAFKLCIIINVQRVNHCIHSNKSNLT